MPRSTARLRSRTIPSHLKRGGMVLLAVVGVGVLAGCSAKHYRNSVDQNAYEILDQKQQEALGKTEEFTVNSPASRLRERLLLDQMLPTTSPASMGVRHLEEIEHWPSDNYLEEDTATTNEFLVPSTNGVMISLEEALQIAARNSRNYQSVKEEVFRSALDLNLERNEYRTTFTGFVSGNYQRDGSDLQNPGGEVSESVGGSAGLSAVQRLKSGAVITMELGYDVIRLLSPGNFTSESVIGDASISIPLMRGAGQHIAAEGLTQAERNVIYAIWDFENFKRDFAVGIASSYLSVLQRQNEVQNAAENYRGLIASTRRAQRLLDAGRLPAIQVDQGLQDELSARNRWVSAREAYSSSLDSFKIQLGLPTDADIQLNQGELSALSERAEVILEGAEDTNYEEGEIPPADAEIVLELPSAENAGPMELDPDRALQLAFENRLDLAIAKGRIYDAQRGVVIAADSLRPGLTLFGSATYTGEDLSDLSFESGSYQAILDLDLPLERTSEATSYRNSLINLERTVRDLQDLEDNIKFNIIDRLRDLREARESLRIQALSVELAERRVRGANLELQAGRVEIRDLLEAQESLLSAQNSLTAATVNYRVAELEMQRDLGVLEVNNSGLWKEYQPQNPEEEPYETASR